MIRFIVTVLFLVVCASGASAQNCGSYPNILTNGTNADATQVMANFNAIQNCVNGLAASRGYINGLILSTPGSSAAFGVAAGSATSDDATTSMKLSSATSKTMSAWAVGSGNGSLDTGSIVNNTWYHVFLIERTDTGTVDVLISLSAATPGLPANYTKQRRIGSMKTNASAQWTSFSQNGDEFLWLAPATDVVALAVTSTPSAITLSVPTGIVVNMLFQADFTNTTASGQVLLYPSVLSSQLAGTPPGNWSMTNVVAGIYVGGRFNIRSNTLAQCMAVSGPSNNSLYILTSGWIDTRGRFN